MEHCLRLALWMFLFIGYLQATPVKRSEEAVKCFHIYDLDLDLLLEDVCLRNSSVKFTSPTDVQKHCYSAALNEFLDELKQAETECPKNDRTQSTADALKQNTEIPKQPRLNSTDCHWGKKQFTGFVADIKNFAEKINTENGC